MTKPAHDKLTFIRIGGAWQPVVTGFHDFPALLDLDAVHWGMTSIAVEQLRTDKNFLRYLDSDGDGKIRVSEIRDALSFMISVFADGTGLDQRSDVLHLPHAKRSCFRSASRRAVIFRWRNCWTMWPARAVRPAMAMA